VLPAKKKKDATTDGQRRDNGSSLMLPSMVGGATIGEVVLPPEMVVLP
jgi:hypothetical protein